MPVVEGGKTSVDGYLPDGKWIRYTAPDSKFTSYFKSSGQKFPFDAPIDQIPVLIRHGSVIPALPPKVTTTETRQGNLTLIVFLDDQQQATGELYHDDGDSLDTLDFGLYSLIKFAANKNNFTATPAWVGYEEQPIFVERLVVMGLDHTPTGLTLNDHACKFRSFKISDEHSQNPIEGIHVERDDCLSDVNLIQPLVAKWS